MRSGKRRPQKKISLRKRPVQSRARATVGAILEATTYILARSGWQTLTTNAIAKRAGVNIASLYQYFPNKEAIVAELRRVYLESLRGCELASKRPKTLAEALRSSVETLIRQRLVNPELHRVFEEELPRSTGLVDGSPLRDVGNFDPSFLRNVPDVELAAFVARTAVVSVIDAAAREHPALLEEDAFKDELVTLMQRYLRR